jgi:N-acetylglucosamine repressor
MKKKTGDLKLIQALNRHIILDTIREEGPVSRSKIAEMIGLSPTTVASAVNELIREGFVGEVGAGESSGGRKPILIRFEPDHRFIIGVSITHLGVTIAELNLDAKIKKKQLSAFSSLNEEHIISHTLEEMDSFIKAYPDLTRCLGISIISAGIVDTEKGIIRYNSRLGLENVLMKQMVEERFSLKTWLDNDVNAIVLAEKYLGSYTDSNHLIYVKVSDGIGAGIIVNGSVLRGSGGGAGEFGHTTIDWSGTRCHCGNIGCIGNYADWSGIYSRILAEISRGTKTAMLKLADGDITRINPEVFQESVSAGDALAIQLLEDTAVHLSAGIVNLVNLFNPQVIFIGGELVERNKLLLKLVRDRVYKQSLEVLTQGLEIRGSSFGENDELIGAAAVILQDVFGFSVGP